MAKTRPRPLLPANQLLNLLPPDEYERIRPKLRPVGLSFKQVLMREHKPIEYVYFPARGMVSALTVMTDGATIEVGCVGSEGVAGVSAALGTQTSPHQNIVQVPGEALRMDGDEFAQACSRDGPLRRLMVQYHAFFFAQVTQSVACNGLHSVSQRCCRWLLITHDGAQSDLLPLTHEFLAILLRGAAREYHAGAPAVPRAGSDSWRTGNDYDPRPPRPGDCRLRVLPARERRICPPDRQKELVIGRLVAYFFTRRRTVRFTLDILGDSNAVGRAVPGFAEPILSVSPLSL